MRVADTVASGLLAGLPPDTDVAAWRRGSTTVVGAGPADLVVGDGATALPALDALGAGTWVGWCSFELGHLIEPVRAEGASLEPRAVPDAVFARFAARAVVGADGSVRLVGDGPGRPLLSAAADRLGGLGASSGKHEEGKLGPLTDGPWRTSLDRCEFEGRVEAIIELLRAGECYQVNLTRRLTSDRALDPAELYGSLVRTHRAPYTGLLQVRLPAGPVGVVTVSPERFLRTSGRRVETRPIKGTARDAESLRASAKDHAENVMIVDLARNDLGRVCEAGSIHVPALCAVEAHPGLHHLVSTVRGTLRDDVGWGALIAATFPPASVTGAPKPRVLQAIEEFEPVRRGVYCGAFGWIDTERDQSDLAVAIRTFTVFPDRAELGVGAGIVADSSPLAEWEETQLKAARLLAAAGTPAASRTSAEVLVPG